VAKYQVEVTIKADVEVPEGLVKNYKKALPISTTGMSEEMIAESILREYLTLITPENSSDLEWRIKDILICNFEGLIKNISF
jgi:hypothetical protein